MRKAIVTGANGFLGSWLVRELLRREVKVFAVIKNSKEDISRLPTDKALQKIYCDADNLAVLPNIIADRDVDCFFHLAWQGSAGPERGDYNTQLLNVGRTAIAATTASRLNCKRFIGAGSLAEKDCNAYIPQNGAMPNLVSCYGTAKMAAHYISKAICANQNIEHIWAYLPNTYGEGNYTQNFVNYAALLMLKGERAAFTSGEQLYEFVHARDTVAGLFASAHKGKPFTSYYIGGLARPLREYIMEIRDVINPNIKLYLGEIPFHGTSQSMEAFDASAIRNDTGFAIKTSFRKAIAETINWLKSEFDKGVFK